MATIRFTSHLVRHRPAPMITAAGATVAEVLQTGLADDPLLRGYVQDEQGRLRKHVNIYLDGALIRDRLRLSREQATPLPCWEFEAGGIAFELWVLPASALRQPPLEPLEDRPLRRATANALRQLIAAGD